MNPYDIVRQFEETIAEYAGSKYAVAVESGTAAIFLSLMYRKNQMGDIGTVKCPRFTYPSVPASIIHAGGTIEFTYETWQGEYVLNPLEITDAALKVIRPKMYFSGLYCLSFHVKKYLAIGRGGMILTDDKDAYDWLKRARFDGREEKILEETDDLILGWNFYMTPEQAARGLLIFHTLKDKETPDLDFATQGYPDCSKFKIFQ